MDSVYASGSGVGRQCAEGGPSTEGLDFDIDPMKPQEPEHSNIPVEDSN